MQGYTSITGLLALSKMLEKSEKPLDEKPCVIIIVQEMKMNGVESRTYRSPYVSAFIPMNPSDSCVGGIDMR